jgi:hypothetical protein
MALNIGDVSEGAFAISLALFTIENDQIKSNSRLKHTKENIKYWMQQIDPNTFQNGGVWRKQLYNGYATLASKVGKKPVVQNRTPKTSNQIPYDIAEINLSISLKAEAVREAFGRPFQNTSLDGIINQMVSSSTRYKSIINDYKNKFMTNHKSEYFRVDISTIGKEGEQSGGAIKGDIQMEMSIQAVDIQTRKPIGTVHRRKFPMYFSLKASSTPPKTISNESPIVSLGKLSEAFGVNVLTNTTENILLSEMSPVSQFTTTSQRQQQRWEVQLYRTMGLGGTNPRGERWITVGNASYAVGNMRIYDLLDPKKFPPLSKAKTPGDRVWKSYVVARYVRSVFNLFPSGLLNQNQASLVWNYLFSSAFGIEPYASQTFLVAFGQRTYQGSSLEYLRAVKDATNNEIFCVKKINQVEFYIGNSAKPKAKLFHIRYKNRTSYTGDIGNTSFNLEDVIKLELKLMPETGDAFKEKSGWQPGAELEFNRSTGIIGVKK